MEHVAITTQPNPAHPHNLDWLVERFDPVGLDQLNAKAEMLARIDNKYVVHRQNLQPLLEQLPEHFEILSIDNQRAFGYQTRYFDDPQRSAYHEHHQGLRKGFKVRIRRYLDTQLCYLEVKLKGQRGMTLKHRLPHDPEEFESLNQEALSFARSNYQAHYQKPFNYHLEAALDLFYRRITLVAKQGSERMTLDTQLRFNNANQSLALDPQLFIVEIKSKLGRGLADRYLRSHHQRPTSKCSKYCIGMAALGQVSRFNRFIPTMRQLGLMNRNSSLPQAIKHQSRFDKPTAFGHLTASGIGC